MTDPDRARPICFINAQVVTADDVASTLRFSSSVLAIGGGPQAGDVIVDLDGGFVLPGLVNAHDHLELNHYGRQAWRPTYGHAREWVDDMRPRLQRDPVLRAGQAHSLSDRLFIGGLKNLLAGVTTVAHHNPYYPYFDAGFPVRVVRRYGWAHSFYLQDGPAGAAGEAGGSIALRYRRTPSGIPFVVHLAEGTDAEARDELRKLDELGCLGDNSLLVHGVAFELSDWERIVRRRAGLVWCPTSNHLLFGRSAPIRRFLDRRPESAAGICLGTDSRLTGSRDLLDEMRVAAAAGPACAEELLPMVTENAARLLRLRGAGRLETGLPADLMVVPPSARTAASALLAARRQDVRFVGVNGQPLLADPELSGVFAAPRARARLACVDGAVKLLDERLAHRIVRCAISEPGVVVEPCRDWRSTAQPRTPEPEPGPLEPLNL